MNIGKSFLFGKLSGLVMGAGIGLFMGPLLLVLYLNAGSNPNLPTPFAIFIGGFVGAVAGAIFGTTLGLLLAWGQVHHFGTQIGIFVGAVLGLALLTLFAPDPPNQPTVLPLLGMGWGGGIGWGSGRFLEYLSRK